jgi:hypothetical protein
VFAHPLGLLALFALPLIAALHLFRRRFEPRTVSALFLWQATERTPVAGRTRTPLVASTSLLLELLAAAALAFALAGPRPGSTRAEHLVVVLDGSASMAARAGERTARERAVAEVERRLDELGSDGRASLVVSGSRPKLLAGPAAFVGAARAALADFDPRAPSHDLAGAVAFALELSGAKRVVVVTDRFDPGAFPSAVELVAVGASEPNFAFVHATRTRERSAATGAAVERVFVSVAYWGFERASSTLELRAGERTLATRDVALAPGERANFAFELPPDAPAIEARLAPDALALDDVALLEPVPARTLALATDLDAQTLAALGLSDPRGTAGNFARWLDVVPDSVAADAPEHAHFALVGSATTALAASASALVLERPAGEPRDWIGPFLIEKRHRAFEGVTLAGVVWSAPDAEPLAGSPLVSVGDTALFTEERAGERGAARTLWRLRLDPARATLARSPDWPILLANLAELRRAELPGFSRVNVALGEAVLYRAGAELAGADPRAAYRLVAPDGSARELPARAELVLDSLDRPGIHELSFAGRPVGRVAVSFVDPRESDLGVRSAGRRLAEIAADSPEVDFAWPELALVAFALACVLGDFFVLARGARRAATFVPGAG